MARVDTDDDRCAHCARNRHGDCDDESCTCCGRRAGVISDDDRAAQP